MAQGISRALDDCGLETRRCRWPVLRHHAGAHVGAGAVRVPAASIRRSSARPSSAARRSSITSPRRMAAIQLGLCNVAVIAYGSTQRSVGAQAGLGARDQPVRDAVQAVPAGLGLCHGGTPAHASIRHHARADGRGRRRCASVGRSSIRAAWDKKPLTIEGVLTARPISDPFTVRDCCLSTDGGGAHRHDVGRTRASR